MLALGGLLDQASGTADTDRLLDHLLDDGDYFP